MKKILRISGIFLALLLAINSVNATEVAFVDLVKVVNTSKQVKMLKEEQNAKAKEILAFIDKARKDVAKTTDIEKKKKLDEKYHNEFVAKKENLDKDYNKKFEEIEKTISKVIESLAKEKGYDLVISKGFVLYGTDDITDDVIKALK